MGHIDCLGATDEPTLCRSPYGYLLEQFFFCRNNSRRNSCVHSQQLCNEFDDCAARKDEKFCENHVVLYMGICQSHRLTFASDMVKFLWNFTMPKNKYSIKYFTLDERTRSGKNPLENLEEENPSIAPPPVDNSINSELCHRGKHSLLSSFS